MSLASRLVLEAEIETATRLETLVNWRDIPVAARAASSMAFECHLHGRPVMLSEIGGRYPKLIDAVVAEAPLHQVVVGQLQQHDVALFAHGARITLDFDAPAEHLMPSAG